LLTSEQEQYFYRRLGELIKTARSHAGMTQLDLATFLGMSRISIVNIEAGKQKVQMHTLMEIANYLKLSVEFFESARNAVRLNVSPELEQSIKSKVDSSNIDEVNILKEFVQFTFSITKK